MRLKAGYCSVVFVALLGSCTVVEQTDNDIFAQHLNIAEPKDVFLVLTNASPDPSDLATVELLESSVSPSQNYSRSLRLHPSPWASINQNAAPEEPSSTNVHWPGLGFNPAELLEPTSKRSLSPRVNPSYSGSSYDLNEAADLWKLVDIRANDSSDWSLLPHTNRWEFEYNGVEVEIWVENGQSWTPSVTDDLLNKIGNAFFRQGEGNDVYEWVVDMAGQPWGSHGFDNLIDDGTKDIRIVFQTMPTTLGGTIQGFFSPVDTLIPDQNSEFQSNRGLMFYLNGASYFTGDSDDQVTIISTLAHEFQHMIHWYQQSVFRFSEVNSEPWYDEMLSMAVEDLVAEKLAQEPNNIGSVFQDLKDGRLVNYLANASSNTNEGRFPFFSFSGGAAPYGPSYALGAYIIRNFGGAQAIGALVQTDEKKIGNYVSGVFMESYPTKEIRAIENLLQTNLGRTVVHWPDEVASLTSVPSATPYSFGAILNRSVASYLVSNDPNAPLGFRLNFGSGGSTSFSSSGQSFTINSIDATLISDGASLPAAIELAQLSDENTITLAPFQSAVIFLAEEVSGLQTWTLSLPEYTHAVIVTR